MSHSLAKSELMKFENARFTSESKYAPPASIVFTETETPHEDWKVFSPGQKVMVEICWGTVAKDPEKKEGGSELGKTSKVCVRWSIEDDEKSGERDAGKETGRATMDQDLKVEDPFTFAGQQVGAVLIVKRNMLSNCPNVGEFVKILERSQHCRVKVLRFWDGSILTVHWDAFLPLGLREIFDCRKQRCNCVYENYEKSRAFNDSGMYNP